VTAATVESNTSTANPAAPRDGVSHMVQLDALRALAVTLVMIEHFFPAWFTKYVSTGAIGVRTFFVLSGFLITGILLRCRRSDQPVWFSLRQFYTRRFLRIFPLFYFTLALTALINIPPVRQTIIWHITYLSNVLLATRGHWLGPIAHLWSLAVEEQFYLIWPWVIILVPQRMLPRVIVSVICIAPIFRAVMWHYWPNEVTVTVLTPACMDTLGIGALLALFGDPAFAMTAPRLRLCRAGLWIGLPIILLCAIPLSSEFNWAMGAQFVAFDSGMALFGVWLIGKASSGFGGMAGKILRLPALVYLGTISYGIYMYHNFVPTAAAMVFNAWDIHPPRRSLLVELYMLITIAVASASWFLLERPLNNLKRYFPYERSRR
jgi:peptidoglycan/LPS O-acetylase OafA/YrhL